MTVEVVLLLATFVFLAAGTFFNPEKGPGVTFFNSGPKLGARLEREIATGKNFNKSGAPHKWDTPPRTPTGF